ncbi:putative bifunctional diguanylate cyclase/phosphodiesterase [Zobellella iuensis]|uniref:EAL domain-containing protein n=1 Tax=Zobellella iuensis TaxID=2803811 RepID=A0ABS1QU75_9GAMM|nr:bifunctional diguanylate cyclase/phosphodiesterase [Zobellella iuensis]MBL1378157.1 EAL domain-containing protein [Zobellella iuensis]
MEKPAVSPIRTPLSPSLETRSGKHHFPPSFWNMPARLLFFYFVIAFTWILGSDILANRLIAHYGPGLDWLHTAKGIGFVLVTGLALFGLTRYLINQAWRAHVHLHDSELAFRSAFIDNPTAMWVYEADAGRMLEANQAACLQYGYTLHEFLKLTPHRLSGGLALRFQNGLQHHRHRQGKLMIMELTVYAMRYQETLAQLVLARDMTDKIQAERALAQSEARFTELVSKVPEAFWVFDLELGSHQYISPAFVRMLEINLRQLKQDASLPFSRIHPEDLDNVEQTLAEHPEAAIELEYRWFTKEGSQLWLLHRTYPVFEQGKLVRVIGVLSDISHEKEQQQRLYELANFDRLTGLANRINCHSYLASACTGASPFSLLLLGLDRFKQINDNLGHDTGDALLKQVAQRLEGVRDGQGLLARLSGDEFALIVHHQEQGANVRDWADRLSRNLAQPFELGHHPLFITASLGIARFPEDGRDPDTLLRHLDHALAQAKRQGRNSICFYQHPAKTTLPIGKVSLENALRLAWENKEFELWYQPKMNIASGRLAGFEALLRWHLHGTGPVSPAVFIPILEDTGMIIPVGYWLIEQACTDLRQLADLGIDMPVAVNIAARQLTQDDFAEQVLARLRQHRLPPQRLALELTESSLMQEPTRAAGILRRLRQAQLSIAIDDFGTGYSSLSYLKRFPVDTLKIDRSFITEMEQDADDRSIVDAIIRMAHGLSMTVVAEGVETAEQAALLRQLNCDQIQGYWYARPMPLAQLAAWLAEQQ